ncbi:MAG: SGNH/GDSL hydrolase family protein [Acutalibacteraceae bacterium]|nr:SGNH/GDSL hydrolase family protein [Acutalibacteraceae bacterium]
MRVKQIITVMLALACVPAMVGCDFTAFANNIAPTERPTEQPTEAPTEDELCKVQIQSYDKQNLTDEITYNVYIVDRNGKGTAVKENLETVNGLAHIDLEQGDYRIEANIGSCQQNFSVIKNETVKTVEIENNNMYKVLSKATNVCVIGDSITIGSSSGGYGWYDGLIDKFSNIKTVDVAATGGQTSSSIFDNEKDMEIIKNSSAETYIIALGINDVIYRDKGGNHTTFTTAEYIKNLENLVKYINDKDQGKMNQFVFVAPFEYINKHSYQLTKYIRRENTHQEYTIALYNWCNLNNYAFTAPMNYIKNTLATVDDSDKYTIDDVHPAYPLGTQLYSKAVYESSVVSSSGALNIYQLFYKESNRNPEDKNYNDYPLNYTKVEVADDILNESYFTIKNYNTGEYVALNEKANGGYEFEELSNVTHYYHPTDNGCIEIDNLPKGGYIISFEYNKLGYTSYLDTEIVFVNGGDVITNSYIYMKHSE